MAFRLSEGDLVRYAEIMEGVSLGRMLEFLEMLGLEQTLKPRKGRAGARRAQKRGLPSAR